MRGLLLDITPLRGREYRLLFMGQLVSFLGSMITFVAVPFQMYDLTGSTLAVGALGICQFVPIVASAIDRLRGEVEKAAALLNGPPRK